MTKRLRRLSKVHTRRDRDAVLGEHVPIKPAGENPTPGPHQWPCTQCGGNAMIGYGPGWGDLKGGEEVVKQGERLCTRCFMSRGGRRFF